MLVFRKFIIPEVLKKKKNSIGNEINYNGFYVIESTLAFSYLLEKN